MGLFRYLKNQFRHDRNMKQLLAEHLVRLEEITLLLEKVRLDRLKELTLHTKETGVSKDKLCDYEVIVSLTTFGKRIYDVYLTIESIMQGSVKPNRIVLWLARDEFEGRKLPQSLLFQQQRGLEIRYCEDIRSYKKLIPSLKVFPDACIVTIDDDAIYEYDLLERLVMAHIENPGCACACRVHRIQIDEHAKPKSYSSWDKCIDEPSCNSSLIFPTTGGGVLYPPKSFSDEVFNKEVFMDICPTADDVWFYSMLLMNDIDVVHVYTGNPNGYYMDLRSGDIDSLGDDNFRSEKCLNDVQLKAVLDRYDLYSKLRA